MRTGDEWARLEGERDKVEEEERRGREAEGDVRDEIHSSHTQRTIVNAKTFEPYPLNRFDHTET